MHIIIIKWYTIYDDLKRKADSWGRMEECCQPIHGAVNQNKKKTNKIPVNDTMLIF